jgi:ribonuclease HII
MGKRIDPSLLPSAPDLSFEDKLWKTEVKYVAGIDEAGRGALAGPVAAAAVILPPTASIQVDLLGVRDSKQLTPPERTTWADCLQKIALCWGIGFASHEEIDLWGIIPATRIAVQRALDTLVYPPDHLLLDYLFLPECGIPQTMLVKGDARSLSIAGASILAKTARDKLLAKLAADYPGYHFEKHKGYGTSQHMEVLDRLGPSPIHRQSFAPIKDLELTSK